MAGGAQNAHQTRELPRWLLATVALTVIPLAAIYLCAPVAVQALYRDSAEAHRHANLNFFAGYIRAIVVPCHGWLDAGFEYEYQMVRGEKPRAGRLCRGLDRGWVWHPDPRG